MAELTLDAIAAAAAAERGALATTLLAAEARRGAEVWAPLCGEPWAPGMEAIYEGYLLHYGHPRLFAPRDDGERLLCGDHLYAQGLVWIAALGDLQAIDALATLIGTAAAVRARGDDDNDLWAATALALAGVIDYDGLARAARALRLEERRAADRGAHRRPRRRRGATRARATHGVSIRSHPSSLPLVICDDLREWIDLLGREGELVEVTAEVDPHLEISEIADRVVKAGGPALLFRNVRGSSLPLLINQFGTERRMCLAFGVERLDELGEKVSSVLEMQPPQGMGDKLRALGKLKSLADSRAKIVSKGPCQEVVLDQPDLDRLPIADLLARRRRAVHHAALGLHEGPAHGRAQRRHVPAAEVRRDLDGPALADPQGRRLRLARGRGAHGGRDLDRQRSDHGLRRLVPGAQARRRDDGGGLPARQAGRDGAVQDRRPAGARARRDRARGLLRARRAAPTRGRSATTPATTRPPSRSRCCG